MVDPPAGGLLSQRSPTVDVGVLQRIILGCIAQLVEQWPLKPTVAGSNPATPTVANTARSGYIAPVAQWIEQKPSKLLVAGSIPARSTVRNLDPVGVAIVQW